MSAQQLLHFSFLTLEGRSIGGENQSPSRFHRNARQGTSDPRCASLIQSHKQASDANSYRRALTTLDMIVRPNHVITSFHLVQL
jgi:hypothetical protein